MFGSNPYIKLLKKFYKKGALTPKQISKVTKCKDLEDDYVIKGLLEDGLIEQNSNGKMVDPNKYSGITMIGFFETDEERPYRITQKGANQGRVDTITEDKVRYIITTIIAVSALLLSVYDVFNK